MNKPALAIALALFACLPAAARAGNGPLDFLLGHWAGSGSGHPGQGAGAFSFEPDLQGRVLVRRAHSEYPASEGRPLNLHDDLLIVYADNAQAVYFDNEGHVIHYQVSTDPQHGTATFLSVDPAPAPLFRLTYAQGDAGQLKVVFDISATRDPADFKTYVQGTVTRQP